MITSGHSGSPACLLLAEQNWGSGLQAIRSLAPSGAPVYVAVLGSESKPYAASRDCAGAAAFSSGDARQFVGDLLAWAGDVITAPVVAVLPLSDRLVDFLDQSRGLFPDRFRLGVPPAALTQSLLDKASALALAEGAGLNVPRWVVVSGGDGLADVDRLRLPVIVRPTRWSETGDEYFKLFVCDDRATLHRSLLKVLGRGARVLVQEYIDDPQHETQFGIVWRSGDGTRTAVCTGRKRRESTEEGGVMAWGETVPLAGVRDQAARFLDESGFRGLGGIEFIESRGTSWFVEFNPRLEAIHFLAARAGVDTVLLAFEDLARGRVPSRVPEQRPAAAWVGSAWLTRLTASPGDLPLALQDRLAFARAPHRVKAVWSWKDPVPGLVLGGLLVRGAWRSFTHRMNPATVLRLDKT